MSSTSINYNAVAGAYANNRQIQPELFKALLTTAAVRPDSRVLEIGCGTGNYITALKSAVGANCYGLDPSAGMLTNAKKKSDGVQIHLGRAEFPGFPSSWFDLVYSVDVIHHVKDVPAYFRAAYRLLRDGGKLCTVTDSASIIRRRQPLVTYFPETVEVELERYPRIADLRLKMKQAGLAEITETEVEFQFELTDIQIFEAKAFSSLHLISSEAFERGIERMRHDIRQGPLRSVSRYILLWGNK